MFGFDSFFKKGLKNTVEFKNNSGFTFGGPIIPLKGQPRIDRWHTGEFSSAEYTVSINYDENNREIIKFLLVATPDTAKIAVYSRIASNIDMVDVEAILNNAYVDLHLVPKSSKFETAKITFNVNYFKNHV